MGSGRIRIVSIAVVGAFLAILFVLLAYHGPPVDLAVYQLAGRMFATGRGLYEPGWGDVLAQPLPYTYPPIWAALMAPFGWLPWQVATIGAAAVNILVLWWVTELSYRPVLIRSGNARPIALAGLIVILAATAPLASVFWFGQVGILLTAACLADVVPERTKLPRGILVGLATAVKLTPAIFILYWVVTRRWRAAVTAAATATAATIAAAVLRPDLSRRFWTDVVFRTDRVGDASFVSNQSLYGWLLRSGWSSPWVWACLAVLVAIVGLRRAAKAHGAGNELAAATLVGITSVLISPVSWIHHGVWIVPASGLLLGEGRERWRRVAWTVLVAAFLLRLPDWAASGALSVGPVLTAILENAYLWGYAALLFFLPVRRPDAEPAYVSVGSLTPS